MKTSMKLFALGIALLGFGMNVNAQSTVSESSTATASARIITPIAISEASQNLSFGNIEASSVAGTVSVPANSSAVRTTTGGVFLPAVNGTVAAALFTVTGESGINFEFHVPTSVSITDGTHTMSIDNFVSSATGTLTGGTQDVYVGARLNVSASQAAGSYTGQFTVTVNYN